MRSLTFLDHSGDTSIVWDEDSDDKMLDIIRDRMEKGFIFYIVKPSVIPFVNRQVRAKTIDDAKKAGSVVVRDEDVKALFMSGHITTVKADDAIEVVEKSTDPKKIVKSSAVAIRPVRGG